jgi:hypothetical protein
MKDAIQKKATFLIPPLPLVEEPKDKDEKLKATDLIEFILKQWAGSTSSAPTYKLKVSRFCEGTVSEWISFRKAIAELWKQNGLNNAQDKIANICTILRGDLLTGFEEKIQELTTSVDDTGETVTMHGDNRRNRWRRLKCRKPKTVDATSHAKAQGAFNSKVRSCCRKT